MPPRKGKPRAKYSDVLKAVKAYKTFENYNSVVSASGIPYNTVAAYIGKLKRDGLSATVPSDWLRAWSEVFSVKQELKAPPKVQDQSQSRPSDPDNPGTYKHPLEYDSSCRNNRAKPEVRAEVKARLAPVRPDQLAKASEATHQIIKSRAPAAMLAIFDITNTLLGTPGLSDTEIRRLTSAANLCQYIVEQAIGKPSIPKKGGRKNGKIKTDLRIRDKK